MEKKDNVSCVPSNGFKIEPKKFRLDIRKNPFLLVSINFWGKFLGGPEMWLRERSKSRFDHSLPNACLG